MKKVLLGTTALVSAGLIAGPALASDPLAVTVGGSIITGFYVIDQDTIGATAFDETKVAVVARNIDIRAEGTLDNGLVAGALAKLQLGNDEGFGAPAGNDATFSELYAYLEGGFGRVEIGGTDGVAFKMHYTSPWFVPGNGVDSPNIYNAVATAGGASFSSRTSTFSLLAEDDNKISYFTPRIGGFQLGVSYTPDVGANDPVANGFGIGVDNANVEEVFEIAGNFAGEFGGFEIGVDGFYVSADSTAAVPLADPKEYGFGANVAFGGFTLGGAWYESEDIGAPNNVVASQFVPFVGDEKQVWTIGLSYGSGPWIVGVSYLEAELESLVAVANGDENSFLQIGGGYSLGAGVDVGLDIQIITDKAGTVGGGIFAVIPGVSEVDSNSAGLVLAITF